MSAVRSATRLLAAAAVLLPATSGCEPADVTSGQSRRSELVWYVEGADGTPADSQAADRPINPASVVKVATTLWALERLGPRHRYETRFGYRGTLDAAGGVLDGDLIVLGGADPDFHVENAWLVARALNELGVREVTGKLLVDGRFWIGWEGGSERRETDAAKRVELMASRLGDAFDPDRWSGPTRKGIEAFVQRRGIDTPNPPAVRFRDGTGNGGNTEPEGHLLVHRSNPLRMILKRFNAYSNNDIERLGHRLGSPDELAAFLTRRWSAEPGELAFETLSGLGTNRMTPRQVVDLLSDLVATCDRLAIDPGQLLPVAGCDPGTLKHFPELETRLAGALTAKTGTLTRTDGGVAVLAGLVRSAAGEQRFCVAAPGVGTAVARARAWEQSWLLERVDEAGGPAPRACGTPVPFSDELAEVRRSGPTG